MIYRAHPQRLQNQVSFFVFVKTNIKFSIQFFQKLNVYLARVLSHQSSLTSQVEVADDRKALRDALYQGIFHRHRRTIFAIGSFLRMLKSRNSQYNTIRSSSEDENTR